MVGAGERLGEEFHSTDPGEPDSVVAVAARATASEVATAVAEAERGVRSWRAVPAEERAAALVRAASWLRERRLEITALEVRECAKPWPRPMPTCARQSISSSTTPAVRSSSTWGRLLQVPGERNDMRYGPRGVTAVVSPWNFPVAIPCGMTSAALATGNAVILKPAEQSPGCALMLVGRCAQAGFPLGDLAAPRARATRRRAGGPPGVDTIAFTGSMPVGVEIARAAAEVAPGQRHLKHVVAELGGKNCVIVDADADLDEAVPGIVSSAFVYAGQKCSAAARVLVHEAIADQLIERVAGAVSVLVVGQADQLGTDVPPVIERAAKERVDRYAAIARDQGRIVARVDGVPEHGWFCPPTVAADLPPDSPVLNEEIFGPLLAIDRVKNVAHACDIVDGLPFALTGGLFARDPATVRYVRERSPVGNLYVNRGITGAMVGRQPFGGNRLSGTGSKAGGPDYLRQFVEPHVVTENTMRHGLVV